MTSCCLVWSPIESANGGTVEYPALIADSVNAPVFTHHCHKTLSTNGYNGIDFIPFGRESLVDSIIKKTPFSEININFQYANWKPPEDYDTIITRGPKAIHTVQRIGQRHIHLFDGSYRGFFLHKDRYEAYHSRSPLAQTLLAPLRLYFRTAIQGSVNTIDTVIVNSEWTADIVESLYNRKADEIIYPLMTTESYDPEYQTETEDGYFLYLGAIDPLHYTDEVIQAFNELPYQLKVAGDGWQITELRKKSADNIEFVGYVTGDEKRQLLANANALVNPADHSFGRVLIESLASGTPIISVHKGYPPYLLDDGVTGILYERGKENLIQAVQQFKNTGVTASTDELVSMIEPFRREKNVEKWQRVADI